MSRGETHEVRNNKISLVFIRLRLKSASTAPPFVKEALHLTFVCWTRLAPFLSHRCADGLMRTARIQFVFLAWSQRCQAGDTAERSKESTGPTTEGQRQTLDEKQQYRTDRQCQQSRAHSAAAALHQEVPGERQIQIFQNLSKKNFKYLKGHISPPKSYDILSNCKIFYYHRFIRHDDTRAHWSGPYSCRCVPSLRRERRRRRGRTSKFVAS